MIKRLLLSVAACLVGIATYAQWTEPTVPPEYADGDGPVPYEFVNTMWVAADIARLMTENITYNDDNTITLQANEAGIGDDGIPIYTNNACLGNSTVQAQWDGITTADFYTTIDQNWFIIVGTDLSEAKGDSYLWWFNGANAGTSVPQDYSVVLEDGRVLLAWDVTKTGLDTYLQDEINYQNGWTCFGLTPISEDGVSIISDISFYTWEEAVAKYPELDQADETPDTTTPYEFVNTMWVTADTGRLLAENITYNDDNTITAEATMVGYNDDGTPLYTNNICLGNSTERSQLTGITTADYHTTIDQNWFIIVGTELSTVLTDSYLWWLNGYNNGSSVVPIYAIELEADNKVLIAWEVTLTAMDANLQKDVNIQDGWTCFGVTPTNVTGISTISDISFYSWTEAIAKYPELKAVGGEKSPTASYISLMVTINDAENACPDTNEVFANKDVKASYEEALATAKTVLNDTSSTDDDYTDAAELLNNALEALQTSITLYAGIASFIDETNTKINEAYDYGWIELIDELQDIVDNFQNGYEEESLTDEQINSAEDDVTNAIADYISQYVQAGDDITLVINNPNFDTNFSGWTVTGTTPVFGGDGISGGGENTIDGGIQPSDLGSGNAEVYHAVFDMSQTIKNMPAGLYTLSCSGFARDDGGDGIQAELYASVNGNEQTQTLASLYSEGSEEMLYDSSSLPDLIATLTNGETAYVPNCMAGANIYFSLGYYQNQFNILVEERGDLTIGVRETNTDDWVIFDNFKLIYQGNDASAYTDLILELIEQAQEVQSQGTMTAEADERINDAINQGYDVLSGDSDAAVEAVNSLREAIAAAEVSMNLISDLEYLVEYTNEVRLVELTSSIDGEILDVIEKVYDALEGDGFETDAEVQGYMESLKGTFNKCVIYDNLDATEANPVDVSSVILTRDCVDEEGDNSHYGWELTDESVVIGESYGAIEIFNQTAGSGIEQVLYNLYAGWYRLGVQAFYRPGDTYGTTCPIEMAEEENDTIHYADLYAGSKATRVNSIFSDAKTYNELEGRASYSTYTIPNTMAEASTAFSDDLYHNTLQFEVTQDGTDVPVGLVKTGYLSNDWLIWSHWTLEYLGTTQPTEDPTTDIEGVEGNGNVVSTAIYGVSGTRQSRLAKGLNIVKETLSDGTVKVSKVLVK